MQKIIFKIIKTNIITFIIILLCACSARMTEQDAVMFFQKNKDELLLINEVLLDYPDIDRIDNYTGILQERRYDSFNLKTQMAYSWVKERMIEIGINRILISRRKDESGKDCVSIFYNLRDASFYEKDAYSLNILYDNQSIEKDQIDLSFPQLDKEYWYVNKHKM